MVSIDQIGPVYRALRDGTFIDNINEYTKEQIQPFLPSLLVKAFFSPHTESEDGPLDELSRCLLDFWQYNALSEIMQADFNDLQLKLETGKIRDEISQLLPFETAAPLNKLKFIAYVMDKMSRNVPNLSSEWNILMQSSLLEEVVCCMTACALFMPVHCDPPLIIRAMLSFQNSVDLITLFICNILDSIDTSVDCLLTISVTDDESLLAKNRNQTLMNLLSVDPFLVESSIDRVLNIGTPSSNGLVLTLMCHYLNNAQLSKHMLSALLKRSTFATYIQKSPNKQPIKFLHERIIGAITNFTTSDHEENECRLAQLLAALRGISSYQVDKDESLIWMLFLTRTDFDNDQYAKVALSAIIACSQLIPVHLSGEKELEASLRAFLDWVKHRVSSQLSPSLQQFFILVSIHLHANHGDELAALISSVLSFKVSINPRSLAALKSLFVRYAMSERDIAEQAAQMPVTKYLSEHHQGYLPAHCVTQLMKTFSFSRNSIPIQDWIGAQMNSCATPLHPVMTELLSAYASSCFPAPESQPVNAPLSQQFVNELFSGDVMDEKKMISRVFTLFFLLSYRSNYEKLERSEKISYYYSDDLDAIIPIRFLLNVVESRPTDYRAIRSQLIRLSSYYYPHMLPTFDSLLLSIRDELASTSSDTRQLISNQSYVNAFDAIKYDSSNAVRCIMNLQRSSLREQLVAKDAVVHALRVSLDTTISSSFVYAAVLVWKRLENVVPRALCEATVRAWTGDDLTHNKLVNEPLFTFRCDERVYNNEILFSCFLRILGFYLAASRASFRQQLQASSSKSNEQRVELEELTRSLTGAQDSAVVQILLELCGRTTNEAVQQLCCGQIHQMFIADPLLSRLVHCQGYHLSLIPIAVRNIPSMHICLEFVHDILANVDLNKRIFAIILITELSQQYKIESSFLRVDLLLDVLMTLSRALTVDENLRLMLKVVPALGKMINLFPQIAGEVVNVLSQTSAIAAARLELSATVLKPETCFEKRLITLIANTLAESVSNMVTVSATPEHLFIFADEKK